MTDFVIVPRGPFSLDRAADVVAHFPPLRHQPGLRDGALRLGFITDGDHKSVAVSLRAEPYGGVLHGTVAGSTNIDSVRRQVARILSLDIDGRAFPDVAKRDPKLAPIMKEYEGLRPVSFTSPYECACWAIISQRIGMMQAAKIVAEMVRAHGETIMLEGEPVQVFPRPDRLLDVANVPGLASTKLERLHGIALAALEGKLDAAILAKRTEADALSALQALPGIGPFWSSCLWFRACGVHHRFPGEPISTATVAALHGLGAEPDPVALAKITAEYEPFGMWVAFLLRVATNRSSERQGARRTALPRRRARRAA